MYFLPVPPLLGSLFIYSSVQQKFMEHLLCGRNTSRSWDRAVNKTKFRLSWNYVLLVGNRPITQWIHYTMPMEIHSMKKNKAVYQQICPKSTLLREQRESRALTLQTSFILYSFSHLSAWGLSNNVSGCSEKLNTFEQMCRPVCWGTLTRCRLWLTPQTSTYLRGGAGRNRLEVPSLEHPT